MCSSQVVKPEQSRNNWEWTLEFNNLKLSYWKCVYWKALFFLKFFFFWWCDECRSLHMLHICTHSYILYYGVTLPDLASFVHGKKRIAILRTFGFQPAKPDAKFINFWKGQVTLVILPSPCLPDQCWVFNTISHILNKGSTAELYEHLDPASKPDWTIFTILVTQEKDFETVTSKEVLRVEK